jgi:hypothetical protein
MIARGAKKGPVMRMASCLILSAGLVALSACHVGEKGAYEGKRDTVRTSTTPQGQEAWGIGHSHDGREYPQISVGHSLRNHLAFGEPVAEQGQILKVTVPVRLLADRGESSRVQYRFIFLKDNGTPLRDQPDWRHQRLAARQQAFLSMSSTDAAADWRLEVRSAE